MKEGFKIGYFGNRIICYGGVGRFFYQDGIPISLTVSEFEKLGIEVSFFHVIEEFWENGWSWKTIEMKLRGEIDEDIDKILTLDFDELKIFYDRLEQPRRKNGGYEESREMIFKFLFGVSTDEVRKGRKSNDFNCFVEMLNNKI